MASSDNNYSKIVKLLLPCPVCGEPTKTYGVHRNKAENKSEYHFNCIKCGVHGPYGNTLKEAKDGWNSFKR